MNLYQTLPTSRSIRVLSFRPAAAIVEERLEHLSNSTTTAERAVRDPRAQAIHCELSVISLTGPESFDALSYVWGNPAVNVQYMVCNESNPIPITFNLWTALHQIWEKWPHKILWVDVICINQVDIPERNRQVTMMGSIYGRAQCVVVWLGQATQKSTEFFKVVKKVQDGEKLTEIKVSFGSKLRIDPTDNSSAHDLQHNVTDLANDVLSRPWFNRVWTLQEIQLGRKAIVCCGSDDTSYKVFLVAMRKLHRLLVSSRDVSGASMLNVPTLNGVAEDRTILRLLAETRKREATDPRDKIYSLLSLLPPKLYDFMEADYSLSVEETFTWVARVCLELDRDFGFLASTGLKREQPTSLPSWVPDWKAPVELDVNLDPYRYIEKVKTDAEIRRIRSDLGWGIDRRSRKIEILGFGVGRLEIAREDGFAYLVMFPKCATSRFQSQPSATSPFISLSTNDFIDTCKKITRHDFEQCKCLDGFHRVKYFLDDMPLTVDEGDWIWKTETNMDEDDMTQKSYFAAALRPVDIAHFQLVEKFNRPREVTGNEEDEEGEDEEGEDEEEDEEEEDYTLFQEPVEFVRIRTKFVII